MCTTCIMHTCYILYVTFYYNIHVYIGIPFGQWSGALAVNGVAVMVTIAINGFHSRVSYQWFKDGSALKDEVFPVMYTADSGVFGCRVWDGVEIDTFSAFNVLPGVLN